MLAMRYHNVTTISPPEAARILDSAWLSCNPAPVMNLFDRWFDIRRMTSDEVRIFTDDFMREIASAVRAGVINPH
jgi:hypothetical protein